MKEKKKKKKSKEKTNKQNLNPNTEVKKDYESQLKFPKAPTHMLT